jgi:hypothetical protein
MINEIVDAVATITDVLNDCGNRIYKLKFDRPLPTKIGNVALDLSGHESERALFFNIEDNKVIVNIHQCPTLKTLKLTTLGNAAFQVEVPRVHAVNAALTLFHAKLSTRFYLINPL